MKLSIKYISLSLLIFLLVVGNSCTDALEELNEPPNSVTSINPNFVFSAVQKDDAFYPSSWVMYLQYGSWVQHFGDADRGFTTSHYQSITSYDNGFFEGNYGLLGELTQIKTDLLAGLEDDPEGRTKLAIAEILAVKIWERTTALVGDIPFSEAVQGVQNPNTLPAYDPQSEIYPQLITMLDNAISRITNGDASYGSADFYYEGDLEQWRKFGNSLKLKIGMRMKHANPSLAQQVVTEAMNSQLLSSNADNAEVPTFSNNGQGANANPMLSLYRPRTGGESGKPFIGEALVETLKAKNDPRLPVLAEPTQNSKNAFAESGDPADLVYRGLMPALSFEQYDNVNLSEYSYPSFDVLLSESVARPAVTMSYAEVSFLKAEAALEGWGATEAQADEFYRDGVRAALTMNIYGDFITPAQVEAYLNSEEGSLTGTKEEKLEQIAVQRWISLFDRSFEAFFEWRRTGYPVLDPGDNPGETGGRIPRRGKYSTTEAALNNTNYEAAVSRQGPDTFLNRIWIDANPNIE
jgi:hypothetical protein